MISTITELPEQVLHRLFDDDPAQFSAWVESTQKHTAANSKSSTIHAYQLPSKLSLQSDELTLKQLCQSVHDIGYALYEWIDAPENVVVAVSNLLKTLSLDTSDTGVIRELGELSLLQDLSGTPKGRFPPYQSKAMNWHTDGYYNAAAESIRCFTLHCVEPAAEGGALLMMDDTYLILALLQDDPQLVNLLSHPDAMTLPDNKDEQGHDRPARTTPLILKNTDGSLSMRFTTRSQNISWRCDATKAAAQRATELIDIHKHWQTRLTLKKGQGIITRNILHAREAFIDTSTNINSVASNKPLKRQMLRGRFTTLPTPYSSDNTGNPTTESTYVAR